MTKHMTAAEINDACEAAFKQSADLYDLRVFDFARLIEATVSIREREACADVCENLRVTHGNGDPDGDECAEAIRARSNVLAQGRLTAASSPAGVRWSDGLGDGDAK